MARPKIQTAAIAEKLLDEIKAARDLVDYITLHHIDYQES